ncbi:MAG: P63C domain-containing protein [Hyphomicrobiaceae bacterium]|nr:P63C domain-containing protein [Hyphomicrobiaceae bacterium]
MADVTKQTKGGLARAKSLSPKKRSEIASNAAQARYAALQATHGSSDHPLRIGDAEIPCYVLEDGTRVLSQRGLQTGIGMSISGGTLGEQRMAGFVEGLAKKGIDIKDLSARIRNPIRFRFPGGGRTAYGLEATILADICDVVLTARKAKVLVPQQEHIADQCELLVRGFARVGIIALVDEATGYQADRTKDALSKILEAFIAKELQPWLPTFPADFYRELFRLRGLPFPSDTVRRPQYFGWLTNDMVYRRIAPGVLEELQKVTPRSDETGRYKYKFFQRLTANAGYPKLREHLGSVVSIMKLSTDWADFKAKLDRIHPRFDKTLEMPFEFKDDDGKGL